MKDDTPKSNKPVDLKNNPAVPQRKRMAAGGKPLPPVKGGSTKW